MCGLSSLLLTPARRAPDAVRSLKAIVRSNLVFNEERGQHASGIAVVQQDGSHWVFKQPVTASTLVEMEGYETLMSRVDENTVCILGHTRKPTKGSRWNNNNNHPLVVGGVIGIHNGIIANDDELFASCGCERNGEVDSEIIFRLLADVTIAPGERGYACEVQRQVGKLEGSYATLSVDLRQPIGILALKYLQPLCLHYSEQLQALFFSSRYIFLRKAFGFSVVTEALETGHGFYFEASQLASNGAMPVLSFPLAPSRACPANQVGTANVKEACRTIYE